MKKIKKIIAIIIALSLFTPLFVFVRANEEDIEITETQEFQKLEAFGIIAEDDELFFYKTVSRGLFVHYAMKIYGSEYLNGEAASVFTDVSDNITGAEEIAAAYSLGIISGKTPDRFYPDDNITINEAAKILIAVLGYDEIAEKKGGFPSGYMALVNSLDLFKGCKSISQGYLSTGDFLRILINTLETEIPQVDSVAQKENSLSAGYTVIEGHTLLAQVFDIHKAEGIVESDEYTSINGISELTENVVRINEKIYYVNETQASELLGYNTEFYYRVDDAKAYDEIVFIAPYRNEVVEVGSKDIVREKVTTTNFAYYKNNSKNKVTDVKIAKSATMIYNGGQKKISVADLCPENGNVILIDNNRDNVFDVVKVMNYRSILVSGASLSTYTVSDLLGGENITLDPEDKNYNVIIYKDGKKADFSSISSRDVISYAESSGNKRNVKYVLVSSEKVTGTLDTIADDYINIDEVSYSTAGDILKDVRLGEYATFYLDFKGKIVAKKTINHIVYGYLNNIGTEKFDKVLARIFTENNRWVELDFNEKITFNNKRTSAKEVYDKFMAMENFRQLIRYTVDENGKINMIDTAEEFTEYSAAEETAIEQDTFRVYPKISSARYRAPSKSLGNTVRLDESTKIFLIPDQTEKSAPEEDFSVISRNALNTDETYVNIIPYDMDRTRLAKAVVSIGHKMSVNEESAFLVVEKMVSTPNSDGVWTNAIKGYYSGESITLAAKDDSVYDELGEPLAAGDVVQVLLDEFGNITKLTLRYNASEGENQKFIINSLYSSSTFIAGEVYYADSEQQAFIAEGPDSKIVLLVNSKTEVMVYDAEKETMTIGSLADLEKGNSFVARVGYYVADEIVVYH